MTADDKRIAYHNFFVKSEAGTEFIEKVYGLIIDEHDKAEKNPELARDHTQRAKGVRLVKEHIDIVMSERRKPISK